MGVCDSRSKFIYVNVGGYGSEHDSGIFNGCEFGKALNSGRLNLPVDRNVGGVPMPFVFIGDDAFAMGPHLIKPFSRLNLNARESVFNKRLSRARWTIEKAFGMMSNRFQILQKLIKFEPDKTMRIISALCIIHNLLIDRDNVYNLIENDDIELWRDIDVDDMIRINAPHGNRSQNIAIGRNIRENFSVFFNSPEGSINFVNNENE